ncbi:MAG: hypothetical protein ACE5JS_22900 [Nitrospinota bacterium]
MKRNNIILRGFFLLMVCLLVGCASYSTSLVLLNPSGPNVNKVAKGDLTLYIEEYATQEKSELAFDTNLPEEGVLPLLIQVANSGQEPCEVKVEDIFVRGDALLKPLTPEEAASKAERSAVGRAIGWSLIVPIIAIPIAAIASAKHTSKVNKKVLADFTAKAFKDGEILPNKEKSGFLYLQLAEGQKDTAGLSLEMTARNITTGEIVTLVTPVPPATFTQKEDKEEEPEEDDMLW